MLNENDFENHLKEKKREQKVLKTNSEKSKFKILNIKKIKVGIKFKIFENEIVKTQK